MEKYGVVVEEEGNEVTVRFVRSKACGSCNACMSLGENEAQVQILNTLQAHVGDTVRVELHGKTLLQASLFAYILPLCALLLGVFLGTRISDLAGILGGLALAGLAYFVLRLLEPRFARMGTFHPRMISIETNEDSMGGNEHVK